MYKPKVSVIIPNYNHARFLEQRIRSVLQQTYQDFEVILLDDCSTDESRAIIETYRNHEKVSHLIFNDVNSGNTFHQWKKGIELAKGEYIWLAESDDYCAQNFLEITTKLIDENPTASLVYCSSHRVNAEGEYIDDLSFWYNDLSVTKWNSVYINDGIQEIKEVLSIRNTIPNASAVLFRKSAVKPNWNELTTYKLSGDWLFWINLLEYNDVIYTTSCINYFRTHTRSVRSNTEKDETVEMEKIRILKYLKLRQLISNKDYKSLTSINKNTQPSFHRRLKMRFLRLFR